MPSPMPPVTLPEPPPVTPAAAALFDRMIASMPPVASPEPATDDAATERAAFEAASNTERWQVAGWPSMSEQVQALTRGEAA